MKSTAFFLPFNVANTLTYRRPGLRACTDSTGTFFAGPYTFKISHLDYNEYQVQLVVDRQMKHCSSTSLIQDKKILSNYVPY